MFDPKQPLGLAEGTVRALLVLMIVGTTMFMFVTRPGEVPETLVALTFGALGLYGISRYAATQGTNLSGVTSVIEKALAAGPPQPTSSTTTQTATTTAAENLPISPRDVVGTVPDGADMPVPLGSASVRSDFG